MLPKKAFLIEILGCMLEALSGIKNLSVLGLLLLSCCFHDIAICNAANGSCNVHSTVFTHSASMQAGLVLQARRTARLLFVHLNGKCAVAICTTSTYYQ